MEMITLGKSHKYNMMGRLIFIGVLLIDYKACAAYASRSANNGLLAPQANQLRLPKERAASTPLDATGRQLQLPHPHRSSSYGWTSDGYYYGCLALSEDEMADVWNWAGYAPECSYASYNSDGSSTTTSTYSGSRSSNATDSSSSSNSSNSNTNRDGTDDGAYDGGDGGGDDQGSQGTDPYDAFDITRCDTYKDLWTWDLGISCSNETSTDCTCTFAEELLAMGSVSCDDGSKCPKGCTICSTCLMLSGCTNVKAPGSIDAQVSATGTVAAMATLFLLITVCCCTAIRSKRRGKDENDLGEHLMDDDNNPSGKKMKVWTIPVDSKDEYDKNGNRIWLVPEEADSSADAERGNNNPKTRRNGNNLTNVLERSMRKLRPRSADEKAASDMKGSIFGYLARFRVFRGRKGRRRGKTVEDDSSVSTARLNEYTESVFPDILANCALDDLGKQKRRPEDSKNSRKSKNPEQRKTDKNDSTQPIKDSREAKESEERRKKRKEAKEKLSVVESDTSVSLFPDILAPEGGTKLRGNKRMTPKDTKGYEAPHLSATTAPYAASAAEAGGDESAEESPYKRHIPRRSPRPYNQSFGDPKGEQEDISDDESPRLPQQESPLQAYQQEDGVWLVPSNTQDEYTVYGDDDDDYDDDDEDLVSIVGNDDSVVLDGDDDLDSTTAEENLDDSTTADADEEDLDSTTREDDWDNTETEASSLTVSNVWEESRASI